MPYGYMASSSFSVLVEYSSCFMTMDFDIVTEDSYYMWKILLLGLQAIMMDIFLTI